MQTVNRTTTTPVRTPRTVRNHNIQVLTSMMPGLCVPVAAIPLLREDALSAQVRIQVEMMETHELLMNSTNMRVTAYLVPFQAYDRFQGSRDQLDRSYMKQAQIDGGAVVPFFETAVLPAGGVNANPIYKALGLHGKQGDTVNTMYLEAYNQIINMRLKNRSPNLTKRTRLDTTLAPAFWLNSQWQHVVPDFDQATIDGEVALDFTASKVHVRGIGTYGSTPGSGLLVSNLNGTSSAMASSGTMAVYGKPTTGADINSAGIYADLQDAGVTVSLSEIAMAKKAQWFAKVREKYQGLDDEYIIDMLMSGLEIPDQAMKQPILIADVVTKFAQSKRYASDYANMAESAVSGAASAGFDMRVPRLNTGGVVMVMVECLPDQLFERQMDPFFYTSDTAALPEALRDELDVQKVDIVTNRQVDIDHATPAGTFGYEPMNGKWNRWGPRLGGKFHKPSAITSNDEERQRLWAVETANPVLGTSFYLCPPMNLKPFLNTVSDPFEVAVGGTAQIQGNTVFGGMLVEQTNLYQKVMAKAPTTQAKE